MLVTPARDKRGHHAQCPARDTFLLVPLLLEFLPGRGSSGWTNSFETPNPSSSSPEHSASTATAAPKP